MDMLLCLTDGKQGTFVLEYGVWLSKQLQMSVLLLAVIEPSSDKAQVLDLLETAEEHLRDKGIAYQRQVARTDAPTAIVGAATDADLIVFGPLETGVRHRLMRGHVTARLMAAVSQPLLYVPASHPRLRRILIGLGGVGLADTLVKQVSQVAHATGAEVTLLHVQPPSSYDYPGARLYGDWQALRASAPPQARHIQKALDLLSDADIPAQVIIRHGYPANNILQELRQGAYDLVGLGSHHSAEGLRPRFTPNVTSQVLLDAEVPVLVVRHVD